MPMSKQLMMLTLTNLSKLELKATRFNPSKIKTAFKIVLRINLISKLKIHLALVNKLKIGLLKVVIKILLKKNLILKVHQLFPFMDSIKILKKTLQN